MSIVQYSYTILPYFNINGNTIKYFYTILPYTIAVDAWFLKLDSPCVKHALPMRASKPWPVEPLQQTKYVQDRG
jgi:hypothetical protein